MTNQAQPEMMEHSLRESQQHHPTTPTFIHPETDGSISIELLWHTIGQMGANRFREEVVDPMRVDIKNLKREIEDMKN